MKWFKHMTNASNDEFIAAVDDRFGDWGIVRWWRLLETVAAQMDESDRCHAEYSPKKWKSFLKGSPEKLQLLINFFATYHQLPSNLLTTSPKVLVSFSPTSWKIEIPKLLELRDNHTKNLQAKPPRPLASKEVEVEVEGEEEQHAALPVFDSMAERCRPVFDAFKKTFKKQPSHLIAKPQDIAAIVEKMSAWLDETPAAAFIADIESMQDREIGSFNFFIARWAKNPPAKAEAPERPKYRAVEVPDSFMVTK